MDHLAGPQSGVGGGGEGCKDRPRIYKWASSGFCSLNVYVSSFLCELTIQYFNWTDFLQGHLQSRHFLVGGGVDPQPT